MKFCFHEWGTWTVPIDTAHDFKKVQARSCKLCGRVQVKKISQPYNLWFSAKAINMALEEQK